jgi:acyl carrier protein
MAGSKLQGQIEQMLSEFWDEREISISSESTSINDLGAAMDSLTACEAMIAIDELVGETIPVEVVIQNGGYDSRDQFIQQVTEKVINYLGDKNE